MLTSTSIGNMFLCKGLQVVLLPHFQTNEKYLLMAYLIWKKGPEDNLAHPLCKGLDSSTSIICSSNGMFSSSRDIINSNANTISPVTESTRSAIDIISNLPECIKHNILVYLPIKEAVKTCILSKNWQYTWCTIHGLEIDAGINSELDENGSKANERGSRIIKFVDQLLHCHKENLLKFKLFGTDLDGRVPIRWMKILSQKKIRELIVETSPNTFIGIPLGIHLKLKVLVLRHCIFFPLPEYFDGRMLHTLDVRSCGILGGDIGMLVSLCPLLQKLKFEHNNFDRKDVTNIHALNLRELTVFGISSEFYLMTPKLCMANFVFDESVSKMVEFRGNIIRSLVYIGHNLMGSIFSCFVQDRTTYNLQIRMVIITPSVRSIWAANIRFQNFTTIEKLVLYVEPVELSSVSSHDNIDDEKFQCLREATIIPFLGVETKTVFEFAKIILSRAPLLEKLTIRSEMKDCEVSKLYKIPRLSTNIKIMFDNSCLNVGDRFQCCCCSLSDITVVIDEQSLVI